MPQQRFACSGAAPDSPTLDVSSLDTSKVTCMDGMFDFAADKPVSFEQMIAILSRIAATPDEVAASRGDPSAFVDGDLSSASARPPSSRAPSPWES